MIFNEQNTVENYFDSLLTGVKPSGTGMGIAAIGKQPVPYIPNGLSNKGSGWHVVPGVALPRHINDVFVEEYVIQALIRLRPTIADKPERADEVFYKLRAIILSVRSDGLIRINEEFATRMRGDLVSMPEKNVHYFD